MSIIDSTLPGVFLERLENPNFSQLICEKQLGDGTWIKGEFTFNPIQETRLVILPKTYRPNGQSTRAFFRQSLDEYEGNMTCRVVKGFQNYINDVFPNFQEAHQILSEHGHPMEEAERLCG